MQIVYYKWHFSYFIITRHLGHEFIIFIWSNNNRITKINKKNKKKQHPQSFLYFMMWMLIFIYTKYFSTICVEHFATVFPFSSFKMKGTFLTLHFVLHIVFKSIQTNMFFCWVLVQILSFILLKIKDMVKLILQFFWTWWFY